MQSNDMPNGPTGPASETQDMKQFALKSLHVSDAILDSNSQTPYRLYNLQFKVGLEQIQDLSAPKGSQKAAEETLCQEIGDALAKALASLRLSDGDMVKAARMLATKKFAISILPHETLDVIAPDGHTEFGWRELPIRP